MICCNLDHFPKHSVKTELCLMFLQCHVSRKSFLLVHFSFNCSTLSFNYPIVDSLLAQYSCSGPLLLLHWEWLDELHHIYCLVMITITLFVICNLNTSDTSTVLYPVWARYFRVYIQPIWVAEIPASKLTANWRKEQLHHYVITLWIVSVDNGVEARVSSEKSFSFVEFLHKSHCSGSP